MTQTYDRSRTKTDGVITDDGVQRMRNRIGVEIPELNPHNEIASRDGIRHYAHGIGDPNPLWTDPEYARRTRWGGVIAPPTFIETTGVSRVKEIPPEVKAKGQGALSGVHGWYSGDKMEFFLPVHEGDHLTIKHSVHEVIVKRSEFAGQTVHVIRRHIWWNQRGEIVCIADRLYISGGRESTPGERKKYAELSRHSYTPEEIERIEAAYEAEGPRGANPRYWEDVQVGEELPPLVKGPLSVTDIIAFDMGRGSPFILAHRVGYQYRKRHPAAWPENEWGYPDVVERVHWDETFVKKTGNPAPYDYGAQRLGWLAHLMTDWIGDDGFLRRMEYQARRFNYVGDTTWCKGKVIDKYVQDGEHLVECDIWFEDQRGQVTTIGKGVAALPSREAGEVSLKVKSAP